MVRLHRFYLLTHFIVCLLHVYSVGTKQHIGLQYNAWYTCITVVSAPKIAPLGCFLKRTVWALPRTTLFKGAYMTNIQGPTKTPIPISV